MVWYIFFDDTCFSLIIVVNSKSVSIFISVKSNKNKKKESLNAVDDITLPEKMKTPPKEDVEYNSSKTKFWLTNFVN